jgi:hypothetical protein
MNKETLEEAAENYAKQFDWEACVDFKEGAKWQQEQDKNKYSEEDMKKYASYMLTHTKYITPKEWFEQFKKNKQ